MQRSNKVTIEVGTQRVSGVGGATAAQGRTRLRFGLKARMAIAVTALVAAALIISGWLHGRQLSHAFKESVAAQQAAIAQQLAAEVAQSLEAQRSQLERFAADLAPAMLADRAQLQVRLKALGQYHSYLDDFWVVSADGVIAADYPAIEARAGSDVSGREYLVRLLASGQPVLSQPMVGHFSKAPRVVLMAPVRAPDGRVAGGVAGVLRLQSMRFLGGIARHTIGETGYTGVVTRDGMIIAHREAWRIMQPVSPQNEAMTRMKAGAEGTFEASNGRGVPTVWTFKPIAGSNWVAYTAFPIAEAYRPLQRDLERLAGLVLLLSLAGGLVAWMMMERLLAPLSHLEKQVRSITAIGQKPVAIEVQNEDEIGDLARSFNHLLRAQAEIEKERIAALAQARATGDMFSVLYEKSPIGLALLREDGSFVRANPAFQRIVGYGDDELASRSEASLGTPESAAADDHAYEQLRARASAAPYEKEYLSSAGVRVPVRVSAVAVRERSGVENFVWLIAEDVTIRRQMMDALRQSEAEARMLSAAASHTGNPVVIAGVDGRIEWVNDAFVELTGYTRDESLGRTAGSFLQGPDTDPATVQVMRAAIAAGEPFMVELFNYSKGGRRYRVSIECVPVFDHTGKLERFVAMERDITAERDLHTGLKASEQRFRDLTDLSSDWFWETDADFRLVEISGGENEQRGGQSMTGLGLRPWDSPNVQLDPLQRDAYRSMFESRKGFENFEYAAPLEDGEVCWRSISGKPLFDNAGTLTGFRGVGRDITQTKLAERALRQTQERYQRAIDGANDGIWERDIAQDRFYFSDRFDEILGYLPGDMPRDRLEWVALVHPQDLPMHSAGVERMLRGGGATMWDARYRTAGGSYRWLRMRGIAVRGADGRPLLTSGTASDIHEAKIAEHELERHRDHLAELVQERTGKLEMARSEADAERRRAVSANLAKSEFLANMSHELRTPMHAIISFANFGVEKAAQAERAKLQHYFNNIQKSGGRLLSLLNDLLDLSKLEAGKMMLEFQLVEVQSLVNEAFTEAEALAHSHGITLRASVTTSLAARIDPMRMLQVLRNLLSNAIKFTPAGGTVEIVCLAGDPDDEDRHAGPGVEIRVSDTGVGIPGNELEMVFDKFVQSSKTKTGAGGTGLGLAICREIVTAHGGAIHARNNPEPAGGACFVVWLPANAVARAPPRALAAQT